MPPKSASTAPCPSSLGGRSHLLLYKAEGKTETISSSLHLLPKSAYTWVCLMQSLFPCSLLTNGRGEFTYAWYPDILFTVHLLGTLLYQFSLSCMINHSVSTDSFPFAFMHYHFCVIKTVTTTFDLTSPSSYPPCLFGAFGTEHLNPFLFLSLSQDFMRDLYIKYLGYSLLLPKSNPREKEFV